MGQTAQSVSVIIPAYNEEKTIGNVIADTINVMDSQELPYEIIVVDDGSTDKTGRIASQYKATLLTNETNKGKGYSLRRGFSQAQGQIIVTMDSDGEHQPKEIPDLLEPVLKRIDIVGGSRFLGKSRHFTTRLNSIGNNLFNLAIMVLTGTPVTDSQSGFRAVKRRVLDGLNLESDGYEIETEITVKSIINGFAFREKPIICHRREYSTSKVKIVRDGIKIFKTILISSLRE
jgi:glycosyltransferase involved in cell wall biosynthesis